MLRLTLGIASFLACILCLAAMPVDPSEVVDPDRWASIPADVLVIARETLRGALGIVLGVAAVAASRRSTVPK